MLQLRKVSLVRHIRWHRQWGRSLISSGNDNETTIVESVGLVPMEMPTVTHHHQGKPNFISLSKSANPSPSTNHSPPSSTTDPLDPLSQLDTWQWVERLNQNGHLDPSQGEAILTVFRRLAHHHLAHWQAVLPHRTRVIHDRHRLAALTSVSRLTATSTNINLHSNNDTTTTGKKFTFSSSVTSAPIANKLEVEQRARHQRALLELQTALEGVREETLSKRTETMEALAGYRAEGREEGQRLEMERHRLEGRLAARLSQFKSDAENVKVRSMYTFAVVLFSILVVTIADRSTRGGSGSSSQRREKYLDQSNTSTSQKAEFL